MQAALYWTGYQAGARLFKNPGRGIHTLYNANILFAFTVSNYTISQYIHITNTNRYTACPQKHTGWYFSKLFINSKISCISTSFVKEIRILSHISKSYKPVNIFKPAYSRQGCVKNKIFGLVLEPGAFSDKQICENCRACYFLLWPKRLISFFEWRGYTINLRIKNRFWKLSSSLS